MMKDKEIMERMKELATLFAEIPDDVLMRFVNRNKLICEVFNRAAILRALAVGKNTGREQLKAFLSNSVPANLRRKHDEDSYSHNSSDLENSYTRHITCGGTCVFVPALPEEVLYSRHDYIKNAQEVAARDRALLAKLQAVDGEIIKKQLLIEEAEFTMAANNSETAKAESAFRDGLVRMKLAELERYVKEQMTELQKGNQQSLSSMRTELQRYIKEMLDKDNNDE